jgi:hypothetical protein
MKFMETQGRRAEEGTYDVERRESDFFGKRVSAVALDEFRGGVNEGLTVGYKERGREVESESSYDLSGK